MIVYEVKREADGRLPSNIDLELFEKISDDEIVEKNADLKFFLNSMEGWVSIL